MKTPHYLREIVLAGSLAFTGCSTVKDHCESRVSDIKSLGLGECDKIANQDAAAECTRLTKLMRESAMAACLTRESGVAITCTEENKEFHCTAKK